MPSNKPTSIKELLGDLSKEDPDKINAKIRVEIDALSEEIVSCSAKELYLVGRKSRHIFHSLVNSQPLLENGFSAHFLNILTGKIRGGRVCVIQSKKPPKEISLLADAINDGEEKAQVVTILKNNGTKVKNVFCYVSNEKGIEYLNSRSILSKEQIFAVNTFNSEEFKLFNKRLQTYYQSKIEPMDTDHCFVVFSVARKLSKKELFSIFESSVRKALGCKKGEFSEASGINTSNANSNILFVPKSVVNFNFECYDHGSCETGCSTIENLEVEYVQVRLKAELKENESNICLMVFCPPNDIRLESFLSKGKCILKTNGCAMDRYKYDAKQFKKEEIESIVCPQCIETMLSLPLLREIALKLESDLGVKTV